MSTIVDELKITLHHDYLQIDDVQYPVKAAQLIHDMYIASGTTEKDLDKYTWQHGCTFFLSVFNRKADNTVFEWIEKIIKPKK